MNRRISVWIVALVWCISAMAQQALFCGNEIVSPEINQDGTVTFRLFAPNASQVQVTGDFLPNIKVQSPFGEIEQPQIVDLKQVDGVWTYTTPTALTPELYSYKFKVDGLDYLDPSNVYMCRDIASYTNIFIVSKDKGDTGYWYSVNDAPYGNGSIVWSASFTLKMNRRMSVYTRHG